MEQWFTSNYSHCSSPFPGRVLGGDLFPRLIWFLKGGGPVPKKEEGSGSEPTVFLGDVVSVGTLPLCVHVLRTVLPVRHTSHLVSRPGPSLKTGVSSRNPGTISFPPLLTRLTSSNGWMVVNQGPDVELFMF